MENINKELCAKCKGKCCIKSGCDYFVSDFPNINKETITTALKSGNISIVSALKIKLLPSGKKIMTPFLYLRARNVDRDVVDLFSMKKSCSMLTPTGCTYDEEHRPGGGLNLVPAPNLSCHPLKDPLEEMQKWEPYQNLLSKIVTRYTGKGVITVFKEDVERVMYEILTQKFNGVSELEIADITSCFNDLIECFPEEYESAKRKANIKPYMLQK